MILISVLEMAEKRGQYRPSMLLDYWAHSCITTVSVTTLRFGVVCMASSIKRMDEGCAPSIGLLGLFFDLKLPCVSVSYIYLLIRR